MRKALYIIGVILLLTACQEQVSNPSVVAELPKIYPDYVGVTIPAGIAPLNFNFAGGDIDRMDVVVRGEKGGQLHVQGDVADFDIDEWHRLTEQNRGAKLLFTVCVKRDGAWRQYADFSITVSPYALDEWGLTYRRIAPGYEVYSKMGLYQRDLSTFNEYPIIENTQVPGMCINCHSSAQTDGQRELLKAKNELLGGSMVYPYWHPSKQYCAFSTNQTRQGFHVAHDERIEVFDLSSDVFVYHPATHEIITDSLLQTKDWSENSPVFSPDGRWLYYMTCLQREYPADFKKEQYNLCRIAFDAQTGRFGDKVDTLFNAVKMGKSLTWPRPSYDGRYLLFTLQDYGYFSVWHNESDQWLLDLQTGEARPLTEANSNRADSYHNWNVNSHWVVFTSRRGDGLYTRLYLMSIDEQGRASKPFLLPQRNPWDYYDSSLYSFNTPDFTKTKVDFDAHAAGKQIASDERTETRVR